MIPIMVERRVLAGVRFLDAATGRLIDAPLILASSQLTFTRNRSGLFAVTGLRPETEDEHALAAHLDVFEAAPEQPAAGSVDVEITVSDPRKHYLPLRFRLSLPRGEDLATPIDVALFLAPSALLAPNWSGVRASLIREEDGVPVALTGARLTLIRESDGEELARGFSDRRGEVLAVAVGIQVVDFTQPPPDDDDGATPGAGAQTVAARIQIHTGPGESPWPPDPEAIEAEGEAWEPVSGTLPMPALRTGHVETADLLLLLQPEN